LKKLILLKLDPKCEIPNGLEINGMFYYKADQIQSLVYKITGECIPMGENLESDIHLQETNNKMVINI